MPPDSTPDPRTEAERPAPLLRALCVAGGPRPLHWPQMDTHDLVVAADRGADHAIAAGVAVDVVIGDLDSISPEVLSGLESDGVEIVRHRPDKDASDLELAIDLAIERGASSIDVVMSGGGRADHALLAALSLCRDEPAATAALTGHIDGTLAAALRAGEHRTASAAVGDLVTLVALDSTAEVSIVGVEWPLDRATIHRGSTLGLSNVATAPEVMVEVHTGTVMLFLTPSAIEARR